MKDRFAHRLEYRLILVEQCLGARKPERQLTGRRHLLDTAGGSVGDSPARLGELIAETDDGCLIDAAEIDPRFRAAGRLIEPTLTNADSPDGIIVRQHRKHEFALLGHGFG